jgi:hypothetical protein
MVTLPPEAVRVPERVLGFPTTTLPKASEVGVTLRDVTGATPVPASETTIGLLVALLTTEICPEALPAAAGANFAT